VRDFIIATSQGAVMALLVLVAVAAPASAIYYGTELSNVIVFDTWRHPSLVAGPDAQYIVVARFLQLILLIIVSLVPALMYFQFDREKLSRAAVWAGAVASIFYLPSGPPRPARLLRISEGNRRLICVHHVGWRWPRQTHRDLRELSVTRCSRRSLLGEG
jgi:hypothetical protein